MRFVEEQPMAGVERDVSAGTTVGRQGADVELPDPEVSRRHAVFRSVDGGMGVEDLGSRNGTFVNEQPTQGIVALSGGDRVRFGNTVWRLDGDPAAEGEAGSAPDHMPTALKQATPAEAVYGEALPEFTPAGAPSPVLGGSAARRLEATLFSFLVVLATAVAVTVYLALR